MGPRNIDTPAQSSPPIYHPAASIATEAAKERLNKIASDFVAELIAVVDSVLRSQKLPLELQRRQMLRASEMPELLPPGEPDLAFVPCTEWTEQFEWFAAQLPSWPFSAVEAKLFLREYADLSSPILRCLERKHLLVRSGDDVHINVQRARNEANMGAAIFPLPRRPRAERGDDLSAHDEMAR